MSCQLNEKKISAYLDDELNPQQRQSLEVHLKSCANCQRIYEKMKHAWDLIHELPAAEPAPYFFTRLKARMAEKEIHPISGLRKAFVPVFTALAILLGGYIGHIVGQNGSSSQSASQEEDWLNSLVVETFDESSNTSFSEAYMNYSDDE